MTDRPRFDATALTAALRPGRVPVALDRERRVMLIAEAAEMLLKSGTEAGLFCGSALSGWLERGGSLERDYFQTSKAKSHHTASAIWRRLRSSR